MLRIWVLPIRVVGNPRGWGAGLRSCACLRSSPSRRIGVGRSAANSLDCAGACAQLSAQFDSGHRLWSSWPQQPKSGLLPQAGHGGTNYPGSAGADAGTGRTAPGNRGRGHFQGQARQLTSQAFGRASFQGRKLRIPRSPQIRTTNQDAPYRDWPVSISSSCNREVAGLEQPSPRPRGRSNEMLPCQNRIGGLASKWHYEPNEPG
jgi:hypothetical protein